MVKKCLFIVDFDNTLIAKNTDSEIIKALSHIGQSKSYDKQHRKGWAESMNLTLQELYNNNFSRQNLDRVILDIPLLDGMKSFCETLERHKGRHDTILLSHSNQYFIDILLDKYDLRKVFQKIFTYQCEWEKNNKLVVRPYDYPYSNCELCPIDFCKGNFVKTYFEQNRQLYSTVVYIGDGTADFCGALALCENDYALARKDFPLHRRIESDLEGTKRMKAKYKVWESGHDVVVFIESLNV